MSSWRLCPVLYRAAALSSLDADGEWGIFTTKTLATDWLRTKTELPYKLLETFKYGELAEQVVTRPDKAASPEGIVNL